MEVILAKTAGFCFGVDRAVSYVYEKSLEHKIYTYGSIIHNKTVTDELKTRGVEIIDDFENIADGMVVIRAHGVPKSTYEDIDRRGLSFKDCTCPYVKKIHELVSNDYKAGNSIIIVGDPKHPEIIGINGWCDNVAIILQEPTDVCKYNFDKSKKYSIVVQTTFVNEKFEEIILNIKNLYLDINIYNTICNATKIRQDEAARLAKECSHMLILGSMESSNSRKLYEICKKFCKKSYLIESIRDLQLNIFSTDDKIGITAGASTPSAIIKEAVTIMNDGQEKVLTFEEMLDESLITLHTGDIVKGTVISVANGEVSVNLGYKSDGIITRAEFSDDPSVDPENLLKSGDEIEVLVVRVNDGDGNVLLSKRRLDAQKGYEEIEDSYKNGDIVKGKIVDVVKGGLIALINGIRVFVPSSQIAGRYVDDLNSFRGKEFDFNIIEYDRPKRRIVAGRKELAIKQEKEKKEQVFSTLNIGDRVEGTVSKLVDFGAFVDLGGINGLIHISEMSWGRVRKASDVLKEGDKVTVIVLDLDKAKNKISLSLKDITNDPWTSIEEKYPVGSIIEGKVVRMVPFGAFVELEDGVDGLIHISQISQKHVVRPEDELKIGQIVNVKVTEINAEGKKINLSKKEAEAADEPVEEVAVDATPAENATAESKSAPEVAE